MAAMNYQTMRRVRYVLTDGTVIWQALYDPDRGHQPVPPVSIRGEFTIEDELYIETWEEHHTHTEDQLRR